MITYFCYFWRSVPQIMFLNFIEKLKERLQDPLPGQEAQDRMRASIRKPENFDLGWKEPARPGTVPSGECGQGPRRVPLRFDRH